MSAKDALPPGSEDFFPPASPDGTVGNLRKSKISALGIAFMLFCLVSAGAFGIEEIIPSALKENNEGGGSSYQPVERYKITNLTGAIDGVDCRVSFTCAGVFQVIYEGRLIIKE